MTINVNPGSGKNNIDNGNPNVLADQMRDIKLGSTLRSYPTSLRNKVPVADSHSLATLLAIVLPDDAKAAFIYRATARTGTVTGELTVEPYGTTPSTGQIAVGPNGDIVTLAADAITNLDVEYLPERYDIYEFTGLPVASNVLTIPVAYSGAPKGVVLLLEANALVGTAPGLKIPLVPGSGAPSAGQARLNIAKTTVTFASADAITSATVKLAIVAGLDLDAYLTNPSTVF